MTKISTFVAAVARIPVNFIAEVGRDIETLNKEAAKPKAPQMELTEDEQQMLEAMRKRRNQQK
jgi:hypothetical protein